MDIPDHLSYQRKNCGGQILIEALFLTLVFACVLVIFARLLAHQKQRRPLNFGGGAHAGAALSLAE